MPFFGFFKSQSPNQNDKFKALRQEQQISADRRKRTKMTIEITTKTPTTAR